MKPLEEGVSQAADREEVIPGRWHPEADCGAEAGACVVVEGEADARGVYFADGMGYDPREGVKTFELFERLAEQAGAGGLGSLTIFSTHPSNPQRIERMRDLIAEDYPAVATPAASSFRTGGAAFARVAEPPGARAHRTR